MFCLYRQLLCSAVSEIFSAAWEFFLLFLPSSYVCNEVLSSHKNVIILE